MQDSTTSREKILKKVRKALTNKSLHDVVDIDKHSKIYFTTEEPLEIQFAQTFSAINGKFIFCENESEFVANFDFIAKDNRWGKIFCKEPQIKNLLSKAKIKNFDSEEFFLEADIGISLCECLIARTGSIMLSSKQLSGRRLPVYSNYHIVIAYTSQLLLDINDGLKYIKDKYGKTLPSMITTITGPSKTADIEKTLVQGAHGPKEIFVFLIDDIPSVN